MEILYFFFYWLVQYVATYNTAPEKNVNIRFKIVELNSKTMDQLMLLLRLKMHAYRTIDSEALDIPIPKAEKQENY